MILRSLALSIALVTMPLAACSTTGGQTPSVQDVRVTTAKAMYAAEAAYSATQLAIEQAALSGKLSEAQKASALKSLTDAHAYLLAARAAYAVGDMVTVSAQAALTQQTLKGVSQ